MLDVALAGGRPPLISSNWLTPEQYRSIIAEIRTNVAAPDSGTPARTRTTPEFINGVLRFQGSAVAIRYALPDLYVRGFLVKTGGGGSISHFTGQRFESQGLTPVALPFGDTYDNMGWQKNNDGKTITLHDVNVALNSLVSGAGGTLPKNQALALVVAFAEAVRFDGVLEKIIGEREIDGAQDLAWDESTAGVAVLKGR